MVDFLWTHSHCVRPGNGLGRRLSFPAEITSGKAVGWGRALNPCLLIQVTFMRSRAPFEGDMNDMTGAGQFGRHEPVSPSNIPTHIGSRFNGLAMGTVFQIDGSRSEEHTSELQSLMRL